MTALPGPYGFYFSQLDSAAVDAHSEYFIPTGVDHIFGCDTSYIGQMWSIGEGLTRDGSVLKVNAVPQSSITGLTSSLTAKQDALPSQTGNSGKVLGTNGTSLSWVSMSSGSGTVTSVGISSTDFSVSGSPITSSGTITLNLNTSGVTAGTYSGVTVNNKGIVTAGTNRSYSAASRTLNSAYQISTTRDCFVSYGVDVSATISLLAGQTGTVVLEYADNSGMTTNVVTVQTSVNGNTGTLTVGLNLTQTTTQSVTGIIPAGKYVRLRTVNTTGTPTFTYRTGQEVLL